MNSRKRLMALIDETIAEVEEMKVMYAFICTCQKLGLGK